MTQGPNVRKLIAATMALDAIPASTPKGQALATGIEFLRSGNLVDSARKASKWVEEAIHSIRFAAAPNPWMTSTDEEIAGFVLDTIAQKKAKV